ncbi:MAG: FimV/HubP family polar landmark protein [Burkholderiales bacterium]
MGITSLRAWILAASLLAVSSVAHAAGLGKLNVTSALGEPLNAEIELFAGQREIGSLAARLASQEAFGRAGLVYSTVLDNVKVRIEKRANGEPYVRLTSTQPVNEPFLDLLVELSWSSGRISREFTALLDPPSLIAERARQKAAEAEVRASPPKPEPQPEPIAEPPAPAPAAAEPAPSVPVETIGGPMATFLTESNINSTSRGGIATSTATRAATAESFGPVKRGDTLFKIALATKPADVSLEQMLALLFRGNPDAFAGKNMNRLKAGKIIKLPSPDQFGSVAQADARKQVLVQARNWNAYREQLAVKAGEAKPAEEPAQQAAAGKITAKVEDQAAAADQQPKEVLKLSQSEPAAAAAAGAPAGDAKAGQRQARVRALEEELVARDKSVKDANERVSKLEKTIKDLQALLEIKNKGMADLQKPAAPEAAATPAQPVPAQPAPKPDAKPEPQATAPAPEAKPAPAQTPADSAAPRPKTETAPPSQPAPPPKRAPKPAPPPAPEPSLMDRALEKPVYLGAGLGVLVLIGALAVRAVKRRRESKADAEEAGPASVVGAASLSRAFSSTDTDLRAANARAASDIAEEVDPVAEAEIFLAYGRDAQAEDLLKEALAATPRRYEIHLKLLQIFANRKDTKAFEQMARELQQGTGGGGNLWDQAVRLGYQVDPDNPRYAAGRPSGGEAAAGATIAASGAADNVDFNIGLGDQNATTATDIDLGDDGRQLDRSHVIDPSAFGSHEDTTVMRPGAASTVDFSVDLPPAGSAAEESEAPKKQDGNVIDFEFDLSALAAPSASEPAAKEPKPAAGGLDFDMSGTSLETPGEPKAGSRAAQELDLSGINLDLGAETSPQASATGKDDHWYDVQTKFDLAKAYQEMGDKDGAREILKEVLQEGDAQQKAAAQTVLANLDS